jgi:hypothetical protein
MVVGVGIGMDQQLLSVSPWRNKRALDVDLNFISAGDWWQRIPERGNVVFDVIHIPEMQRSDLLPQQ